MGINIHGIRVGYFYTVLKDGSLIVDQYTCIRNDSLERRRKRLTKLASRTAIFKSDHSVRCVHFLFLLSSLVCFVVFPYPVR